MNSADPIVPSETKSVKRVKLIPLPNLEVINRLFDYDPTTGIIKWKITIGNVVKGTVAGHCARRGYRRVAIFKTVYFVHRIIWKIEHKTDPEIFLDHKNGIKDDNRIENLRLATQVENNWNSKPSQKSPLGIKGIHFNKKAQRWTAAIRINGKRKHLGCFDSALEAGRSYSEASQIYFGEFASSHQDQGGMRISEPGAVKYRDSKSLSRSTTIKP